MTRDDLDRLLAEDDTLQPSSGFAASVMNAIESEVSAPRPLAFPWARALPGIVASIAPLVVLLVAGLSNIEFIVPAIPAMPRGLAELAARPENLGVALAAIITIATLAVARRLMRRRV